MLDKFRVWITGSLRTKTTLLIIGVMTTLLAVFVVYDALAQRKALEEALLQKCKSMALSGAMTIAHVLEDATASGRRQRLIQSTGANGVPIKGFPTTELCATIERLLSETKEDQL